MAKQRSKRYEQATSQIQREKKYTIADAVEALKKLPQPKLKPTVTISFRMGVDPRKSEQMVRGSVALPHGSGKQVRVAVFAQGSVAEEAKAAGAEFVGFEDLIKKVQEGFVAFDTAIATPDAMAEVRKIARVLGPRGLMPNPKTGTVTQDAAKAVREAKAGKVDYKLDKNGNISAAIGKLSFEPQQLVENATALVESVRSAKPPSAKGNYIEAITISATMLPGILVEVAAKEPK